MERYVGYGPNPRKTHGIPVLTGTLTSVTFDLELLIGEASKCGIRRPGPKSLAPLALGAINGTTLDFGMLGRRRQVGAKTCNSPPGPILFCAFAMQPRCRLALLRNTHMLTEDLPAGVSCWGLR